jgi:hypothetical protein
MSFATAFVTSNVTCSAVRSRGVTSTSHFMGRIVIIIRPLRRTGVTHAYCGTIISIISNGGLPFCIWTRGIIPGRGGRCTMRNIIIPWGCGSIRAGPRVIAHGGGTFKSVPRMEANLLDLPGILANIL